jgi:hypothetical protein
VARIRLFRSFLAAALLVFAAALLAPSAALAQTGAPRASKNERGAIYINYGYLSGTSDVQSTVSFPVNVETGTFTSKFDVKPGPALDAGARVRIWKRLGAGVAFTSFATNRDATVTAQIPHPFFFGRPRAIEGTASIERKETAVHVRAVVTSPGGRKLQAAAFAGPVFFSVDQTLVDKVTYSDAYPFDTATFRSAATRRVKTSKTGFGIGADVAYYFMKHVGVGLSGTYAKIDFNLKAVDDSTVSVSAGGGIAGLGIRIRF